MFESFTLERFLNYATRYNLDLYPAQYLMLGLGLIIILTVFFRTEHSSRFIFAILAVFYGWIGIQFYMVYFKDFMPIPFVFAILFIIQALIFILEGTIRNRISFQFTADLYGLTGALLLFYALFGYPYILIFPIINALSGFIPAFMIGIIEDIGVLLHTFQLRL